MSHVIRVYWTDFAEMYCDVFDSIIDAANFVVELYEDSVCGSVGIDFGLEDEK